MRNLVFDSYKSGVNITHERDLSTLSLFLRRIISTELHRKCDGELGKFEHVGETKLIRDIDAAGAIRSGSIDQIWQVKN